MKKIKTLISHILNAPKCYIDYKEGEHISLSSSFPLNMMISSVGNSLSIVGKTSSSSYQEIMITEPNEFIPVLEAIYEKIDEEYFAQRNLSSQLFSDMRKVAENFLKGNGLPSHLELVKEKEFIYNKDQSSDDVEELEKNVTVLSIKNKTNNLIGNLSISRLEVPSLISRMRLSYSNIVDYNGKLTAVSVDFSIPYLALNKYPILKDFMPETLGAIENEDDFLNNLAKEKPELANLITMIKLEQDLSTTQAQPKKKI